jgi:hypothetical protein
MGRGGGFRQGSRAENYELEFSRVHVRAEFDSGKPELGLEADDGDGSVGRRFCTGH